MSWAEQDPRTGDWVLHLRVTPRAKRAGLSVAEGQLRIRLTAPPVAGKANTELRRLLAKRLGVPKSAISVEAGERGRDKRIRLHAEPHWPEDLPPPGASG